MVPCGLVLKSFARSPNVVCALTPLLPPSPVEVLVPRLLADLPALPPPPPTDCSRIPVASAPYVRMTLPAVLFAVTTAAWAEPPAPPLPPMLTVPVKLPPLLDAALLAPVVGPDELLQLVDPAAPPARPPPPPIDCAISAMEPSPNVIIAAALFIAVTLPPLPPLPPDPPNVTWVLSEL